jgi:hypothetical protein
LEREKRLLPFGVVKREIGRCIDGVVHKIMSLVFTQKDVFMSPDWELCVWEALKPLLYSFDLGLCLEIEPDVHSSKDLKKYTERSRFVLLFEILEPWVKLCAFCMYKLPIERKSISGSTSYHG